MSLFKFPDHFPLYICITSFKLIFFFVLLASCQFRASKSVNPASLSEPESSLEMSYSHPRGGTTTKETIIGIWIESGFQWQRRMMRRNWAQRELAIAKMTIVVAKETRTHTLSVRNYYLLNWGCAVSTRDTQHYRVGPRGPCSGHSSRTTGLCGKRNDCMPKHVVSRASRSHTTRARRRARL